MLQQEQILAFKSRPLLEDLASGETNRKSRKTKVVSLYQDGTVGHRGLYGERYEVHSVNRHTFRDSNSIIIFLPTFTRGQFLKERSKFLPLRADPFWKIWLPGKQTGSHERRKLCPFIKMAVKHGCVLENHKGIKSINVFEG